MQLTWMGRYRELIRSLVYFSNNSNHYLSSAKRPKDAILLTQSEYQVLEYICEFEDENKIMTDIANDTGMLRSNVTKSTKRLVELGLVDRYRLVGNKKSIILKPTKLGKQTYLEYSGRIQAAFVKFMQVLDSLPDEQLQIFEQAVRILGGEWGSYSDRELEKID